MATVKNMANYIPKECLLKYMEGQRRVKRMQLAGQEEAFAKRYWTLYYKKYLSREDAYLKMAQNYHDCNTGSILMLLHSKHVCSNYV